MVQLNRDASAVAVALGLRCATDITGFGLLGHASHIARASTVTLEFTVAQVPALSGASEAVAAGIRTGGAERNSAYLEPLVDWGRTADEDRALLIDPQTSGGLLVACAPEQSPHYLSAVPGSVVVGRVVPREAHLVSLR
jgi:selenide,water dikinase